MTSQAALGIAARMTVQVNHESVAAENVKPGFWLFSRRSDSKNRQYDLRFARQYHTQT